MNSFTILVVDDEPMGLRLVKRALEPHGYETHAVASSEDAVEFLSSGSVDLVFADVQLPGQSGIQLLKTIKARWPAIEVVVVTAFASVETAVEAVRFGAYDFVMKPFSHVDLIVAVVKRAERKIRLEQVRTRFIERIISAREEERRRMARDMHDGTAQSLASLVVGLRALEEALPDDENRQRASRLRTVAASTVEEVGRMARGLHPRALDDLGFEAAIRDYAVTLMEHGSAKLQFHFQGMEEQRLPSAIETTLYRVLQEALSNAAKHARANRVSLLVEYRAHIVRSIVEDDGHGFDVDASFEGLGLHSMRERTALVDGSVTVESTPGVGTTVFVEIPVVRGRPA